MQLLDLVLVLLIDLLILDILVNSVNIRHTVQVRNLVSLSVSWLEVMLHICTMDYWSI